MDAGPDRPSTVSRLSPYLPCRMRAEPEVIAQALALHDFNADEKSCGTFSGLSIGGAGSNGRLRRLGARTLAYASNMHFIFTDQMHASLAASAPA